MSHQPPPRQFKPGNIVVICGILWFVLIVLPAGCQQEEQPAPTQGPVPTTTMIYEDSRIPPDHLWP